MSFCSQCFSSTHGIALIAKDLRPDLLQCLTLPAHHRRGDRVLRHFSSSVVSRCKLSNTTLNLNSGVYCFLFPAMLSGPFPAYPCVYFSRDGTKAPNPLNLYALQHTLPVLRCGSSGRFGRRYQLRRPVGQATEETGGNDKSNHIDPERERGEGS